MTGDLPILPLLSDVFPLEEIGLRFTVRMILLLIISTFYIFVEFSNLVFYYYERPIPNSDFSNKLSAVVSETLAASFGLPAAPVYSLTECSIFFNGVVSG